MSPDAVVDLGPGGVGQLKQSVLDWARSKGFTQVRITGIRDGGANPGRTFDMTFTV